MTIGQLCNDLTTIVDVNQLSATVTEDITSATAVNIVQTNNESTSSSKGAKSEVYDDRLNTINIPDDYAADRQYFISMIDQFKKMWDGYLGHITAAMHRVELDPPAAKLIHTVPYRARPKERYLQKNEIDNKYAFYECYRADPSRAGLACCVQS